MTLRPETAMLLAPAVEVALAPVFAVEVAVPDPVVVVPLLVVPLLVVPLLPPVAVLGEVLAVAALARFWKLAKDRVELAAVFSLMTMTIPAWQCLA